MSAHAASCSQVHHYWKLFCAAETGTYEKSTWLDLFLAEFMVQLKEGVNPEDIISFCSVSGVVTLVGCELLCGLHRVTSALHAPAPAPAHTPHAPAPAPAPAERGPACSHSEQQALHQYLLRGAAWRCLLLLRSLGVEGLSCGRQLCCALVWVCGEAGAAAAPGSAHAHAHGASPHLPAPAPRPPVHTLFTNKIWNKQKFAVSKGLRFTSGTERNTPSRAKRKLLMESMHDKTASNKQKEDAGSSDSGEPDTGLVALGRSLAVGARVESNHFRYFESPLRDDHDLQCSLYSDPFCVPSKSKPKPQDLMNDKHQEIIESEITPFEFNLIAIDLLQALCRAECNTCGAEALYISIKCINFSLRQLCALQFASTPVPALHYNSAEVSQLKYVLTELLIISLDKVLARPDLSSKVINNGILPMLLRLLEDATYKLTVRLNPKSERASGFDDSIPDESESLNIVKFVFGIGYSITVFFFCLLMQCRSLDKLRDFTEQFKLYAECQQGSLLNQCVILILKLPTAEADVAVVLARKLIASIGRLTSAMKLVRSETVHCATCPRARHKACRARVLAGMHHHHRILGEAGLWLGVAPSCCVALLYDVLASLLVEECVSSHGALRTSLLRTMHRCSACCCYPTARLVENVVRLVLVRGSATAGLALLEHTVYGELGANVLQTAPTDHLPCAICERGGDTPRSLLAEVDDSPPECGATAVGDSIRRRYEHDFGTERRSAWPFLVHYNSLLQLDNDASLLHATIDHLLRVTPRCKLEMKHELLFSVLYPTFIVAKHRYTIRRETAAYFLTSSCLNIFSTLLTTVAFAEQFIQKGGLSYVLELVSMAEFSRQCCAILEIAIVVELRKLEREERAAGLASAAWRGWGEVGSLRMMMRSLHDVTELCRRGLRCRLDSDLYEKLTDVTRERNVLESAVPREESGVWSREGSDYSGGASVCADRGGEGAWSEEQVTQHACTFWRTCARLCVRSAYFRRHLVREGLLLESYSVAKPMLEVVCGGGHAGGGCDLRPHIKLLEALLTVQFAVADVTVDKSKQLALDVLHDILLRDATLSCDAATLEAACEMLVRVAADCLGDTQLAPRNNTESCAVGADTSRTGSGESSADEESGPAVCACETRERDGYEADMEDSRAEHSELGRVATAAAELTELSCGSNGGPVSGSGSGWAGVSHPELCELVVDILTHIINKLVESGPGAGEAGERAAACDTSVRLARACCTRLATALARASRRTHSLTRRLLTGPCAKLLTDTSSHLQELQCSVLELVHVLASQSTESVDLASYLQLFAAPNPPLQVLLPALKRLVDTAHHNMPDFILTFPISRHADPETTNGEDGCGDSEQALLHSVTTQSQHADRTALALCRQHTQAGLSDSPWCSWAVRVGIEGVSWSPWQQGFSASVWLRPQHNCVLAGLADSSGPLHSDCEWTERRERVASGGAAPMHLLSVGHESLVLETWIHLHSGSLTFKLSRPDAAANRVMSEATVESGITSLQWNYVAFNVKDIVQKRKILIQITLYVNGRECETAILPLQGVCARAPQPTCVLVGHASAGAARAGGACHVAQLQLHRAPLHSACSALYAMAHGPNVDSLAHCQVGHQAPNFAPLITPELLATNLDWDQVYEMTAHSARELQDNLLLSFCAHSPSIMNLYHQTVSLPTVFSRGAGGTACGGGAGIPETLLATWSGRALPGTYRGLPPAVHLLGGPDILLYLFARIVELGGSAQEQATALGVLLRLCHVDTRLRAALGEDDAFSLLLTVLATPECTVSPHMLKAFLDAACSAPLLTTSGSQVHLQPRSNAILLEPKLLITLIRAWRQLERAQPVVWADCAPDAAQRVCGEGEGEGGGGLLGTLLLCMHVLLRDDHPHRTFNVYQMNRVNMINHLLLFCKTRALNSDCGVPPDSVSCSLVGLVRALFSTPLLLCHLALVTDFLVLAHQASETFVTHSRSNFYFLLTAESQSANEVVLENLCRRYYRKRRTRRAREGIQRTQSDCSESVGVALQNMSLSSATAKSSTTGSATARPRASTSHGSDNSSSECEQDKNATSSSRKSSTTSEPNIESLLDNSQSLERDGGAEQRSLTSEYVVIDSDEVDRHAGALPDYCRGALHQTRMRAGAAAGGAACEGLLLLLRDTIAVMPDSALQQAVGLVVQPETLLVLANHRAARVRAAALRAVSALARRLAPEDARKLDTSLYYYHLANQVALYPASRDLLSAALALLLGCDAALEHQLEENAWTHVTERCVVRAPPLLALLPCTLHDISLAHNCTVAIRRLVDRAPLKALCELGVTEAAVRCLRIVGAISDATFDGRELLLEDLRALLVRVALKALQSHHHLSYVWEMHQQLVYVEVSETGRRHGGGGGGAGGCHVRGVARDVQCALWQSQLTVLQEQLATSAQAAHHDNYFASVLAGRSGEAAAGAAGATSGSAQVLSKTELAARHRTSVARAVTFLVTRDPHQAISPAEASLAEELLAILVNDASGSGAVGRGRWWAGGGADGGDALARLVTWLLSPLTRSERLQTCALRQLYHAPSSLQALLTPASIAEQRKLAVYLLSILKIVHASPTPLLETSVTDWARGWALQMQAHLAERVHSSALADEAQRFAAADAERFAKLAAPPALIIKSVFSKETLANRLTESAMCITRQVVDLQNAERKSLLEQVRVWQGEAAHGAARWRELLEAQAHERALWHDARAHPASWELDPTEGPGRVRVRLRRCHLNIPARFLKDEHKHKIERAHHQPPLSFLRVSRHGAGALPHRLHAHESVQHMARVLYVTVASERAAELLLSDRCIHVIVEDGSGSTDGNGSAGECELGGEVLSWALDGVRSVVPRRWCLRERAVEIFLASGHAHLVAFHSADEMSAFLKALNTTRLPNRYESETLSEATALWRNGALTNWEYLMRLNGWGGRSYNDLMQYPVLPFVLADYTSKILDLAAPASYRDLRKPMAVQNKNNETHYINNYNYLQQARREGSTLISGVNKEPYHYGSHYSNSGTVLHFLVRLPPFTSLFLNYQDNNFDIPDRTFHSLQTTWRLTSCDSTTDVKELIPEFFYLPELFDNNEGLNLGVRQCGVAVDHVELPPWALNSRLFTLVHRQALESAYVTEHLPHWIDLVFGYKQTGQPAVDAINVFHPATYYGFEPGEISDHLERQAWETMVRTYGQTPRQLFRQPHPHVASDLHCAAASETTTGVTCGVEGARWGSYCGSPACPPPALALSRPAPYAARLQPLPASRTFVAATRASLVLAVHSQPRPRVGAALGAGAANSLALLTWGHSDRAVRLKQRKDAPPEILLHASAIDPITVVESSCARAGCPVWVGHSSGRLLVLRPLAPAAAPHPHAAAPQRIFHRRAVELRAHDAAVTHLHVCVEFGVVVSAGQDARVVVWDLDRLAYVRCVPNRDSLCVSCVTVSSTLGDIATAHELPAPAPGADSPPPRHRSLLRAHTPNAVYIGAVRVTERVRCACYSTAAEGASVNCIAVGLDTGGVRLYSSWELRALLYIPPASRADILSIAYSADSQQLAAASAGGVVHVWQNPLAPAGAPRVLCALNIL